MHELVDGVTQARVDLLEVHTDHGTVGARVLRNLLLQRRRLQRKEAYSRQLEAEVAARTQELAERNEESRALAQKAQQAFEEGDLVNAREWVDQAIRLSPMNSMPEVSPVSKPIISPARTMGFFAASISRAASAAARATVAPA